MLLSCVLIGVLTDTSGHRLSCSCILFYFIFSIAATKHIPISDQQKFKFEISAADEVKSDDPTKETSSLYAS